MSTAATTRAATATSTVLPDPTTPRILGDTTAAARAFALAAAYLAVPRPPDCRADVRVALAAMIRDVRAADGQLRINWRRAPTPAERAAFALAWVECGGAADRVGHFIPVRRDPAEGPARL